MPSYIVLSDMAAVSTATPFDLTGTKRPQFRSLDFARLESPPIPHVHSEEFTDRELLDVSRDPGVLGVSRVMRTRLIAPVSEEASQAESVWGIGAIAADKSSRSGKGTRVAILDTGIQKANLAFVGVKISEQDFTGEGNGDQNGHGTHCGGTLIGRDVNGRRIGVARGVEELLVGKVLDKNGGGNSDMIFKALSWAITSRVNVISMSLGFDFSASVNEFVQQEGLSLDVATSKTLDAYRAHVRMFDALMQMVQAQAAFGESAVVCAASGNESHRPQFVVSAGLPAAAQGVLAVAAVAQNGGRYSIADFSNTFPQVCAPGVKILSASTDGGLRSLSGTSMACPHVAGIACLWWEELRNTGSAPLTASSVMARILASCRNDNFAGNLSPVDRGSGMVYAPA